MAVNVLDRRELYVDVAVKEGVLEEIFLYQVDFLKDHSFRSKEYLYQQAEEMIVTEPEGEMTQEETEETEPVDITELFRAQWELLMDTDVPVEVFATDARLVLDELFFGMLKKYPEFTLRAKKGDKKEILHDFISMGKVTAMAMYDEQQYLSASIRRRLKERYHEHSEELKEERKEHIFVRRMPSGSPYELELFVTDAAYRVSERSLIPKTSNEEALTLKLKEILSRHEGADLIADKVGISFYQRLHNMANFMTLGTVPPVYSLESMFYATGKRIPGKEPVENYVQYIKNLEDMRFGRFVSDEVHSVHTFYLPVRISGESAWKKQFAQNTMWKEVGKDTFGIQMEDGFKGKYLLRAGKEQFVLRLKSVSIKKYLGEYAVLRMETENHCYPGSMDRERINTLAAALFLAEDGEGPDCAELKLKANGQAYSLAEVRYQGNEGELWLNGLLMLGAKKKEQKRTLVLSAVTEKMYCIEAGEREEEAEIIRTALLRDGILKEIETRLASCSAPQKNNPFGSLTKKQRKQIRALYGKFRYLVVSFGNEYKNGRELDKMSFSEVEGALGTEVLTNRLKEKFDFFFA